MIIYNTNLSDVCYFIPKKFSDKRGFFYESWNQNIFNKLIKKKINFVQDNISESNKGVLRGIHFQTKYPQGKLVSVLDGKVKDVVVDLRPKSKTFGNHFSLVISKKNNIHLWIPEGFGHGYLTLSKRAIFHYKVTNFYNPKYEKCIIWNDKILKIVWNSSNLKLLISKKDLKGEKFENIFKKL